MSTKEEESKPPKDEESKTDRELANDREHERERQFQLRMVETQLKHERDIAYFAGFLAIGFEMAKGMRWRGQQALLKIC